MESSGPTHPPDDKPQVVPSPSGGRGSGAALGGSIGPPSAGTGPPAAGPSPQEQAVKPQNPLEQLAANLAQSLVQEASHTAAHVIAQTTATLEESPASVQPLTLDQLSDLAQDESIIQALIEAQKLEESISGSSTASGPRQIVVQEETAAMQQPSQQPRMGPPQQVQVQQVRVVQPQGVTPRPQVQVQQVRMVQQQVRVVQPGQTQQVITVQRTQQGQKPGPVPGAVQVLPSSVQVQQPAAQQQKRPAPQPPPKPASPTTATAPAQPVVQQIAAHVPVGQQQPQQPAVQQPGPQPVIQQQPVQQQQQQPAVQQPAVAQQPIAQPVVVPQEAQPAFQPQPAAQPQPQPPATPAGSVVTGSVSTQRPLVAPTVQTQLHKEVMKEAELSPVADSSVPATNEETTPRQFYQETIDSRTTASLKRMPCIFMDVFSDMTPEGRQHFMYFLFLCLGATFVTTAAEIPVSWMVGAVYIVSNIMFYFLGM